MLLSERLVKDDVFTSMHVAEYEAEARDTKLGPEEITRDIPNVGEDALKDLDSRGIIPVSYTHLDVYKRQTQGTRPMLLEIQALCAHTQLNIPRRLCSGIDQNRLYMVCAVLEKKIGLKLYQQDIFVNVAGGIKAVSYTHLDKMDIYKLISKIKTVADAKSAAKEIADRYGKIPKEVNNLIVTAAVKSLSLIHI